MKRIKNSDQLLEKKYNRIKIIITIISEFNKIILSRIILLGFKKIKKLKSIGIIERIN